MKIRYPILLLILLLEATTGLRAQFIKNGSTIQTNDSCWTLTPAQNNRVGSIWNEALINLNESFQVIMEMNFGNKDADGADGIFFGFQPLGTAIGTVGGGIGFEGVSPSIGIEFDTWQNTVNSDPSFDHVAIIRDGNLVHSSPGNLAGPIQASSTSSNIEDGQFHTLRVDWDANTKRLEVWFDCVLRLTYQGDIVNNIFFGDPWVFWGFTAATGGSNNVHQVCLSYTTFLDGFEDVVICPGGQFQLGVSGGNSYKWTPTTGLSNPNIPNPIAAPAATTTYLVEVLDECNNPFFDSLTVFIDGDTVFFDLGPDTTICQGQPLLLDATSAGTDTVTYQWSIGAETPTLDVTGSGLYAVTVTIDEYCVTEDRVRVNVLPLPGQLALGPDTTMCLEQILELDASTTGNPSYLWQDGSTDPFFTVENPGVYTVNITNSCGSGEARIRVDYEDCRQVYFPNAFSPNGDGINDLFLPFDNGDVGRIRVFKIFDRWGGQVFENTDFLPNDFSAGWDGRHQGKVATPGVYVWFAEVEFRDGVTEFFKGEVHLVR